MQGIKKPKGTESAAGRGGVSSARAAGGASPALSGVARARAASLRVTPRKLGLVVALIRGLDVDKALRALAFCRRRVAGDVSRVLESAVANAENNHQLDIDRLYVARVEVGKGMVLKRWRARARGRVARYRKFFSKLSIILHEREHGTKD